MDRFSLIQKYKKKLIAITIVIIGLILFLFLFDEPSWLKQLDKDAVYLDIDSVHRTVEEKQKFNELKGEFLSQWLDTANCFMEDFQTGKYPDTELKKVIDVYVDNVFYTPTYDSVVVLVSFYAAWSGDKENGTIECIAMKAIIDSLGNWSFDCNYGGYWILSRKESLQSCSVKYRRSIVAMGILDKNKKIKTDFIHRFFTEEIEENVPESWLDRLLEKIPESGPIH